MAFTTSLVGVTQGNRPSQPLYTWSWTSNYNGDLGGVSATASSGPVNGSGIGGMTITSMNRVKQNPSSVTCAAAPTALWPPNGNPVSVTVSGTMVAGTSALTAMSYSVTDSYGQDQPNGTINLSTGENYSFIIPLIASRNGNDRNGRTYTVYVRGQDTIGNVGVCTAVVTVPHDQGND